jgi:hypothetical protein
MIRAPATKNAPCWARTLDIDLQVIRRRQGLCCLDGRENKFKFLLSIFESKCQILEQKIV